ncbi:hypothetical protein ACFQJC_06660 [Haloferax namakaokahaiae]|uniref:PGF-CTERM sorting domain-containing protein n=1 Tax=Haloferax namakaokahaiae TaxID=1748331 RepID=A0ABD5ZDL7_9EURY
MTTHDSESGSEHQELPRREFVSGLGGIAAGSLALRDSDTRSQASKITIEGAIPRPVEGLTSDNLTGLFVDVDAEGSDADTTALEDCNSLDQTGTPARYDIWLVERSQDDRQRTESTLFTDEETEVFESRQRADGRLALNVDSFAQNGGQSQTDARFIVNNQTACSGPFYSVELERVSAAGAGTPALPGGDETIEPGVQDTDTTGSATPGFGIFATVLAFCGVLCVAVVRRLRDGD